MTNTNGNALLGSDNYQEKFTIGNIICTACGNAIMPNGLVYLNTLEAVKLKAKEFHTNAVREKGILCATPKLIIAFGKILIDASLVEQPKETGLIH